MHPSSFVLVRHPQRAAAFVLLFAVCTASCSKSLPLGPISSGDPASSDPRAAAAAASGYGSASFYPLAIGNAWSYEGGGSFRVLEGDGGPPGEEFDYAFTETHRLIETTHHEGTAYVVEEQVHHEIPESYYGPFTGWDRLRQESSGLFSLDTLLQEPPVLDGAGQVAAAARTIARHPYRIDFAAWRGRSAADPSLERFADRVETVREAVRGIAHRDTDSPAPTGLELRRLVYPLHPGVAWSTRPDFPWPVQVECVEVLDTRAGKIPGYRIGIMPFGIPLKSGEWIRVWYSRKGYLGYSIHTFEQGTNPDGEPTGITYVSDDSMFVTAMQIER